MSIVDWAVKYRTELLELGRKKCPLPDDQVAWFFKHKAKLGDDRDEKLDTAPGPDPSLLTMEAEMIRLFPKMHLHERSTPSDTRSQSSSNSRTVTAAHLRQFARMSCESRSGLQLGLVTSW